MRASVDLPQPDSPTMPRTSPLLHRERDAVDRAQMRVPLRTGRRRQAEAALDVAQLRAAAGVIGRRPRASAFAAHCSSDSRQR